MDAHKKWVELKSTNTSTLYVANFPEDWASKDVKEAMENVEKVKDVFMPAKRNKDGRRFAFVRFDSSLDIEKILETVKGLWVGKVKLLANLARFDRDKSSGTNGSRI